MTNTVRIKPKMLTLKEAAAVVDGLTEHRIRRMCIEGQLKHVRAGVKYLVNQNVLLEMIGEKVA
jgi:hypothetical protein